MTEHKCSIHPSALEHPASPTRVVSGVYPVVRLIDAPALLFANGSDEVCVTAMLIHLDSLFPEAGTGRITAIDRAVLVAATSTNDKVEFTA